MGVWGLMEGMFKAVALGFFKAFGKAVKEDGEECPETEGKKGEKTEADEKHRGEGHKFSGLSRGFS